MKIVIFLLLLIVHCHGSCQGRVEPTTLNTDICILGGSEAGFTAAIQAARMGKEVILIEPTGHPGGMLVEGLGKDIRFGSGHVIGGIAKEFYESVEAHYGLEPDFQNMEWYSKYEPSVASQVIEAMLAEEPNIQILRKVRIKEKGGVLKEGTTIKSVILENETIINASRFIDASIEGHLLHFAGVTTETIREGNAKYGETLNGIQVDNDFKQFEIKVDPYVEEGNPSSGLIATIQDEELGVYGAPSKYIQGFCYRMCLTNKESNMIPITKPHNYDPSRYEIYGRYIKAGGSESLFKPRLNRHNAKTDIGSWHDLSANLYGENWQYPSGTYKEQDSIVAYHADFTQGLIWFLQNDLAVDSLTKSRWQGWGLPKDEFVDNDHWPRRLYIRSGRRMVSDYIITEHNTSIAREDTVSDPVGIAWWPPDVHHARRIVKDGYVYNEGFTEVGSSKSWKPFYISYKATIPKRTECTNLLTPTCVSSSYIGYGAVRIVPTFMILGQSVGAAAAICCDDDIVVQKLNYLKLQKVLVRARQVLNKPAEWREIIIK